MTFRDFMELALYHPEHGYYATETVRAGKTGDFVTSPSLSPVFSYALANLCREFRDRARDLGSTIVDIGAGDGSLIGALALEIEHGRFYAVDRCPRGPERDRITRVRTLTEVPRDGAHLIISNELFDALPYARLVRRGDELHEVWVTVRDGSFDWNEHEAEAAYGDYFASRGIELADGQYADISLDWERTYEEISKFSKQALIVTFDYGFPSRQLFDRRIRRFGTAAAYREHRVHRNLLNDPGEQDLTAHINFDDLIRAGERQGCRTLFFGRQAAFLLALDITTHPLFQSSLDIKADSLQEAVNLFEQRDEARRLVLPDGIGEDIRVLVQEKNFGSKPWGFEKGPLLNK